MNRGRLGLILGGVVVVALMIVLTIYGLSRNQRSADSGVRYTDTISGETFTAFTNTSDEHEGGKINTAPPHEIVITGLDDFYGSLNQNHGRVILDELTAFIRARVGANGAKAGVLDAKINKTGTNPVTYQFTLVLLNPESRYNVMITMPKTALTTPQLTFGEVSR